MQNMQRLVQDDRISGQEALPLWMRQAQRGIDWGTVLVLVFSALIAGIVASSVTLNGANENHAFMAADLADMLREGRLYPRWSPHAYGGYGAPIPNFYPVGGPLMTAVVNTLFTNDTLTALRVVYALAIVLAGGGAYAFAMRWVGGSRAVLTAMLYVLSPCLLLTVPYALGSLPLMLSAALLPLMLWAATRVIQIDRFQDFALLALITFAQTLVDVQALALAALMVGALTLTHRPARLLPVIGALGAGLGMAAFFWVPALWEHDAVRWEAPRVTPQVAPLSLFGLLAPLRPLDPAALVPSAQFTLGPALAVFALIGTLLAFRTRSALRWCAAALILLTAAAVTAARDQYWLLVFITFMAAVVGSEIVHLRGWLPARLRRLPLPAALVMAVISALPGLLAAADNRAEFSPEPAAQLRYEQYGLGPAVLPPGLPLPVTLPADSAPNRVLRSGYDSGALVKIPPEQLVGGAVASTYTNQTHGGQLQVTALSPLEITYLTAYFDGWQASVDGESLAVTPHPDSGLISVTIPPGRNRQLVFTLGPTPPRVAGWALSGAMLVATVLITGLRYGRRSREPFYEDLDPISRAQARLLLVTLCACALLVGISRLPGSPLAFTVDPFYALDAARELRAPTEPGLELLSYLPTAERARPGDTLELTLFWRAVRSLPETYQVSVQLQDANRLTLTADSGYTHPGGYPTSRWRTGGYVSDQHGLTIPADALPGSYRIGVAVAQCADVCTPDDRLRFFIRDGAQTILWLPEVIRID
jgi:hypothetical protein